MLEAFFPGHFSLSHSEETVPVVGAIFSNSDTLGFHQFCFVVEHNNLTSLRLVKVICHTGSTRPDMYKIVLWENYMCQYTTSRMNPLNNNCTYRSDIRIDSLKQFIRICHHSLCMQVGFGRTQAKKATFFPKK